MWRTVLQAPRNSSGKKEKSGIQATKVRTQVTWFLNKTNMGIQLTLHRAGGKVEVLRSPLTTHFIPPPVRPSLQFVSRSLEQGWTSQLYSYNCIWVFLKIFLISLLLSSHLNVAAARTAPLDGAVRAQHRGAGEAARTLSVRSGSSSFLKHLGRMVLCCYHPV